MLTERQLKVILDLKNMGRSIREIADLTEIPKSTIGDYLSGKTYRQHMDKLEDEANANIEGNVEKSKPTQEDIASRDVLDWYDNILESDKETDKEIKNKVLGKTLSEIFREEASKIITDGWNRMHPEQSSTGGYISPFTEVDDQNVWKGTDTPILNKDTHIDSVLPKDWNKIEIEGKKIDFSLVSPENIAKELLSEKLLSEKKAKLEEVESFAKGGYSGCYISPNADCYASGIGRQTWGERVFYPGPVEKTDKKILVVSDTHGGHMCSLTPPEFWVNERSNKEFYSIQRESWEWFSDKVKSIGKVDAVVANGDLIEGKGYRSGATEMITTDLIKQTEIAIRLLEEIKFDKFYCTTGTASHTSEFGEDFESLVADRFKGIIKDHLFLDVNGCILDIKHDIPGSSLLSGRTTAVIKAWEWACKQADNGTAPRPDVILRSHVHFCMMATDNKNFIAMTTPALQSAASKYGKRKCQGITDFGFIEIDIPANYSHITDFKYKVHLKNLESNISRLEMV